jgi:glucosylceramidase
VLRTGGRKWARLLTTPLVTALLISVSLQMLNPVPARAVGQPEPGRQIGVAELYVSSSQGDRLTQKPSPLFGPAGAAPGHVVITIDDGVRLQRIDGFGASLLEAGMVTLNTLPSRDDQDAVLRALFDRDQGAGFSIMKTVIGSTDFQSASQDWYTYDQTPGDVNMGNFSIARDLGPNGEIPYIKRARDVGGDFVLIATMDYPPDWMLVDPVYYQDVNPAYYEALARYFVEYLRQYEQNGVHIDYLSPFNEPGSYTKINYYEMRQFLGYSLGPALDDSKIGTRLMLSEDAQRTRAAAGYPIVLADPNARKYIAGLPYHGYDWDNFGPASELHNRYPDLPLWLTEICCGDGITQARGQDFATGDFWGQQIFSELESGASAWIYWNAILNEEGGPWLVSPIHGDGEGNSQASVVVIDRNQHTVTYSGLYYYLAHFSKFVRPGAQRIGTGGSLPNGVRVVSFQNADGTIVTELMNSTPAPVETEVDWHGQSLTLTLPPVSISTLKWDPDLIGPAPKPAPPSPSGTSGQQPGSAPSPSPSAPPPSQVPSPAPAPSLDPSPSPGAGQQTSDGIDPPAGQASPPPPPAGGDGGSG